MFNFAGYLLTLVPFFTILIFALLVPVFAFTVHHSV